MKKTLILLSIASVAAFTSCDLDLYPETGYNEGNVKVDENETQYMTRDDIKGLRDALYSSSIKNIQECGYLDWLVYAECRADNAYGGNPGTGELMAIEANTQDGENKNVDRDWNYYQNQMSAANQVICNIDRIKEIDPSMTDTEYKEWKSEALIWRAYNLYCMTLIWGEIPVLTAIPPAITSENIEEVYEQYFPPRKTKEEVYAQMIEDLEYAAQNAPSVNPSDKYVLSTAFAHGLLARVYAEKQARDWNKVIEHCTAVEAMGFKLVDDYGDMWAYDDNDAVRNTSESIFEVTWTRESGNWVWMMFHRNAYNKDDSYSWIKWITPSRDLISLYDKEGDTERKNACMVFDECTWSQYYPSDAYAFMHKVPTNASSTILMRLGEIYLLHAEALTMTGKLTGAGSAEYYVNLIRQRAGLKPLTSDQTTSQEAMLDAVLKERRMELAFEGFRFFDLARHDKAKAIHDAMPEKDSYWQKRMPLTEETMVMPIPVKAMDTNPSLIQNPGY